MELCKKKKKKPVVQKNPKGYLVAQKKFHIIIDRVIGKMNDMNFSFNSVSAF